MSIPTKDQNRLLYLISLYSKPSEKDEENVTWVRETALRALMYEGIVKKVFSWDYAPASIMTAEGRQFVNISQEGEDDINDLRELGLIDALKLSTSRHYYITAYCVSKKGLEELAKLPKDDKAAIDELVTCECGGSIRAEEKDGKVLIICEKCKKSAESGMMDVEDVSYSSKAYIPVLPVVPRSGGG